jgi:beta-lactamase regulating signal transducer with metallopeptidase domain/tetratricopeptide (TPR) repeat protein
MLGLPAATALLPAWRLPVLPARREASPLPPISMLETPLATPVVSAAPVARRAVKHPVRGALARVSNPFPSNALLPSGTVHRSGRVLPAIAPPAPRRELDPVALVMMALLVIAVALLARLGVSLFAAARLSRRGDEVTEPVARREFDRAREELGLRGTVRLRSSPRVAVPMVSGLQQPTLLLPPEASEWPQERLRVVFMHELAHVRRRDGATLLLARAACAVCWFHPLVWTLARAARQECERACDDLVLRSGVRASEYAEHLVGIARTSSGVAFAGGALAFARPSSLEWRILSILRLDARRGPASRRGLLGAAMLSLALLLPIASVRVVAAPATPRAPQAPQTLVTPQTPDTPMAAALPADVLACDEAESAEQAAEAEAVTATEVESPETVAGANDDVLAWNDVERPSGRSGDDWFSRGKELYDAERYAQAGVAYENAASRGHRNETALYNAACSYALAHQTNRALGALVRAIEAGFDDWEMIATDTDLNSIRGERRFELLLEGMMHSNAAESARRSAVESYESLRGDSDADANDWRSLGITLMRSGDHERSIEAFRTEFRMDSSANAIYNLACAQALAGSRSEALATLQRSVLAGSGDPDHMREDADLISLHEDPRFTRIAELAEELSLSVDGRDDDRSLWRSSLSRFQDVAQRHPDAGRAWFNLGYAQLRARESRGSLASFGRALDLGYRPGTTMYNLGCAAAQSGDRDAAFAWLERSERAGMELENYLPNDHDLTPLRSDARFRALLSRLDDRVGMRWVEKHKTQKH